MSTFPKTRAFIIQCKTGCDCRSCRPEYETRGPWSTLAAAKEIAAYYSESKLLSSQYSSTGVYKIRECEAEQLPDGRLILDGRLIAPGFAEDTLYYSAEALLMGENIYLLPGKEPADSDVSQAA